MVNVGPDVSDTGQTSSRRRHAESSQERCHRGHRQASGHSAIEAVTFQERHLEVACVLGSVMPRVTSEKGRSYKRAYNYGYTKHEGNWINGHVDAYYGLIKLSAHPQLRTRTPVRQSEKAAAVQSVLAGEPPATREDWRVLVRFIYEGRSHHRTWTYCGRVPTTKGMTRLATQWQREVAAAHQRERREHR
jgi:hypothetical protein